VGLARWTCKVGRERGEKVRTQAKERCANDFPYGLNSLQRKPPGNIYGILQKKRREEEVLVRRKDREVKKETISSGYCAQVFRGAQKQSTEKRTA